MTITESGRTRMDAYLQALTTRGSFADFLTDDVTLDMVGAALSAQGRAQVEDFIRYAHEQAFDARPELKSLIVDPMASGPPSKPTSSAVTPPSSLASRQPASMSASPTAFTTTSPTAVSRALRIYGLAEGLVSALK